MNWLAHLYLSEPTPAFRIGNLLPDLARVSMLAHLPAEFHRGMAQHHRIDAFTDSHAIVRRSILRVDAPFRRYAGILVDMFYDHFLARDWSAWSPTPLTDFTTEVYTSFDTHGALLPPEVCERLAQMKAGDWLCSYGDLPALAQTLGRIGRRFRQPVPLAESIATLERHYEEFRADFNAFFPELRAHVGAAQPPAALGKSP
ncbi:MAG TPA: ACP phosphodiesterase [Chthoniobacteraceae bacterium]|jgi:acyl carrier protein phosphodiesterase|nr:ACP phosphodiesterase [Chthoniobacteraceae bacterium]